MAVKPYGLDITPVTNAEFLECTGNNSEWQHSSVPPIFAGSNCLTHWACDTDTGSAQPDAPLTNVSWFAVSAFCSARG